MINTIAKLVFILTILLTNLLQASDLAEWCHDSALAQTPVLAEGRAMALNVYAQKIRKTVFAESATNRCSTATATEFYCYLSTGQKIEFEKKFNCQLKLKADHIETYKLLGLTDRSQVITPELALANQQKLLTQYHFLENQGQASSGLGTDLGSLLTRIEKYQQIVSGNDWKILQADHQWLAIAQLAPQGLNPIILASSNFLNNSEKKLMAVEAVYESMHPFAVAIVLCLIIFVLSLAATKSKALDRIVLVGMIVLGLIEVFAIIMRVMISGRAPITNMFETVMWVGLAVFILSFILGLKLKNRSIWSMGIAGNAISLFMLNFSTSMLDGNIQPLVPVLRDNFWLSTHVTSVTTSYACFAFSWLIANFVLFKRILGNRSVDFLEKWNAVIRIGMQIGAVFLAAGVILGGVWADYSWGRFWGWDPKETWSLVALIIYMGVLHGRYVGWFKGIKFTMMAGLAFLSVIMAWFGVNYILAVGLHSYGFSSGGATFIASLVVFQILMVGLTQAKESNKSSKKLV